MTDKKNKKCQRNSSYVEQGALVDYSLGVDVLTYWFCLLIAGGDRRCAIINIKPPDSLNGLSDGPVYDSTSHRTQALDGTAVASPTRFRECRRQYNLSTIGIFA